MKAFFSARSPLWQIVITLTLFPLFMLAAYSKQHDTQEFNQLDAAVLIAAACVLLFIGIYTVMLVVYNRRHPSTKVSVFGISPVELKDEDEGMQMLTARATRAVYTYHTVTLPLLGFALLYLPSSIYTTLTGLMLLLLGHYVVYWRAIWPAFQDLPDES